LIILYWQTVIVIVNDRNSACRQKLRRNLRPARTTENETVSFMYVETYVSYVLSVQ